MTLEDVKQEVARSQAAWQNSFCDALSVRDDLFRNLLYAIATGTAEDPQTMAATALQLAADEALPGPRP